MYGIITGVFKWWFWSILAPEKLMQLAIEMGRCKIILVNFTNSSTYLGLDSSGHSKLDFDYISPAKVYLKSVF